MSAKKGRFRYFDHLSHMFEAVSQALTYVEGVSKHEFLRDRRTQDAVILKLLVVGEAATQVMSMAPDFVTSHPDLPWKSMRGMRNRMAHGYFEIDLDIVWDTVNNSLPELQQRLRSILSSASRSEG